MFRPTHSALAVLIAASTPGPAFAHAEEDPTSPATAVSPEDPTQTAHSLGEVVVTGSNNRRAKLEGVNPVQVIAREELETSGKTTAADLLRSISANTGSGSNETQNTGWASAAAGLGLRGLSQTNPLELPNGRGMAN